MVEWMQIYGGGNTSKQLVGYGEQNKTTFTERYFISL